MSNDSIKKTILVALGVCLVCSILVSTAAVSLKGIQKENQKLEKLKNILSAGDLLEEGIDIESVFSEKIQSSLIELETGRLLSEAEYTDILNVEKFDIRQIAKDNEYGRSIPRDKDIALIRRMPKYMVVYQVKAADDFSKLILPVYGKGLWSTMYGFIALDRGLRTIKGFTFYEHGETPGLGGEVDNPSWKKLWVGKQAYDMDGNITIQVIKGKVDASDPLANSKIDGLSGSTLTTRGVDNLVKFWLGDEGYGSYIKLLREEAGI